MFSFSYFTPLGDQKKHGVEKNESPFQVGKHTNDTVKKNRFAFRMCMST